MIVKRIIKLLFVILFISLAIITITTIVFNYNIWLEYLISFFNYEKYYDEIFKLITKDKFLVIQSFLFISSLSVLFIVLYFNRIYEVIIIYLKDLFFSGLYIIKKELKSNVRYLLILPILSSIYFAFKMPISYDEAWTYINFTSKSILSSLSYYPAPNNHILYSLMSNITYLIPLLSPLIKLRIPSIIINIFTLIISSHFLKKFFGNKVSLIIISLFPMLFMGIYYSYMARGYGLLLFSFIISLYFAFKITKETGSDRNWIWFTFFSVIGFYTIPSYLYAFIIVNSIILVNKRDVIRKLLLYDILIVIISGLLYMPVIIVSGINSLINNKYVTPISRIDVFDKLPSYFASVIENIFGFNWYIIVALLLVAIFIFILKNEKMKLKLFIVLIILPPILLIVHSVVPPTRTFNYYGFLLVLIIVIAFDKYIYNVNKKKIIAVSILFQLLLFVNFNNRINKLEDYSIETESVIKGILGNYTYTVYSGLFDAYLIYYLDEYNYTNYEFRYGGQNNVNTDTICNSNYIIVDKNIDKTINNKPMIENRYFSIYITMPVVNNAYKSYRKKL